LTASTIKLENYLHKGNLRVYLETKKNSGSKEKLSSGSRQKSEAS